MDVFLGLFSLFFDSDTKRREMYGKAGAFRPKSYGVEYRTLSNVWLKDVHLMKWVFNNTVDAVKRLASGDAVFSKYSNIADIINTSDKNAARDIIIKEGIGLPHAYAL